MFIHGDLQVDHVFVDGDEVTGIVDWSEAAPGDALFDLATLTLGHEERLDDVLAGYGTDVDRDLVRAWWSLRCLLGVRWLAEHGFGPPDDMPEVAVLRARMFAERSAIGARCQPPVRLGASARHSSTGKAVGSAVSTWMQTWSAPASRWACTRAAIVASSPHTTNASTSRSLPPSARSSSVNPCRFQLFE